MQREADIVISDVISESLKLYEKEQIKRTISLSIIQRQRELEDLFTKKPWVIEDYIYQNYTERAIYLNDMRLEAKASFDIHRRL